jgi:hypothetical protein
VPAFRDQIRREGAITFRSWEGRRRGGDTDEDLRFGPDGKVELVEFGFVLERFEGTYRLDWDGLVIIELKDYPYPCPLMRLGSDSRTLTLFRCDGRNRMFNGVSLGPSAGESYWPFRPPKDKPDARPDIAR